MPTVQKKPPIQMFLPPETLKLLGDYHQELPDELVLEEEMLILFSDMRGFITEQVEQFPAQQVYQALRASMMVQARLIHRFGGTINKFLGDGLLACFSGTDKAVRAIRCVQQMMLNLPDKAQMPFQCKVGFGLHSGTVLFGVVGDDMRREFALIGDVVNTAARLCGQAGAFQALSTTAVWLELPELLREKYLEFTGRKRFRGKKQCMDIYRVRMHA